MPQSIKKEKASKKRALNEAIELLKMKSFPGKNMVTQRRVCILANQSKDAADWANPISEQTLKSKKTYGLGYDARIQIIQFRTDLKNMVLTVEEQLLDKIKVLSQENESLSVQIVTILVNELELKKEINQLTALISRKNDEISSLNKTLNKRD